MDTTLLILAVTLFLALANGANDNFKGVATLYGSRTLSWRASLAWATIATLAGSLTAAYLSASLAKLFSGKGLVPDAFVADPAFTLAIISGAAITVMLAARVGIPISTTHALVGALTGAGIAATSWQISWGALLGGFFWPLVASPFVAFALAALLYRVTTAARGALSVGKETCVCLSSGRVVAAPGGVVMLQASRPEWFVAEAEECREIQRYDGRVLGVQAQSLVTAAHVASSGAVSFARGLNDTPKIVGVALVASQLNAMWLTYMAAVAMAAGGLLASHRIAKTMSHKITDIQHGRGLVANVVTSFLVIVASRWGVPVSTTHVSCGSIFGIGAATREEQTTNWSVVRGILLAWVTTLPMAAALAAGIYLIAA
jgi:PiT family inorganic phosphate transporter